MPSPSLPKEGPLWWGRGKQDGGKGQKARRPPAWPTHLEGLDKGPQQDADGVTLAKQLDQPRSSEEAEEAEVDEIVLQRRGILFSDLQKP